MKKHFLLSFLCFLSLLATGQDIQPTVYEGIGITGNVADVTVPSELGIVLMGGSTDVDQALEWMINRAKGGDVVIIRASGSTGYNDYIYEIGEVKPALAQNKVASETSSPLKASSSYLYPLPKRIPI
jgi:cyanophycinase